MCNENDMGIIWVKVQISMSGKVSDGRKREVKQDRSVDGRGK